MAGRLAGKVAVVTGAGSGIGAATVEAFHREGAKVVAADISGAQEDVAKRLGDGCLAVHTDVSKTDDIKNMLAAAVDTFGRLDILHNNAGIDGVVAPTGEYSEEDFDHVWSINGRAVFLGMRYAIPIMLENGGGSIVNTASMASMNAFPGMPAYCASKAGLGGLTRDLAQQWTGRKGIRVNALAPGFFASEMTDTYPDGYLDVALTRVPAGRKGDPRELAATAVWLASDAAGYVTGQMIPVDGGLTIA